MGKRNRTRPRPGGRRARNAGFGGMGAVFLLAVVLILYNQFGPGRQESAPDPVAPVAVPEAGPGMEDGLQVYFLDVGQGDSELIRIPAEGTTSTSSWTPGSTPTPTASPTTCGTWEWSASTR